MRNRIVAGFGVVSAVALAGVGFGASATQASSVELGPKESALARSIASQWMTAPGSAEALKVGGSDLLAGFFPGEQPWGAATSALKSDQVIVVRVTEHVKSQALRSAPGVLLPKPIAVTIAYDLTLNKVVFSGATFTPAQDARMSLTSLAATNSALVVVPVSVAAQDIGAQN